MTGTIAQRSGDFISSIGVVTQLSWTDTTWGNFTNVQNELSYLGIHYVREGIPSNGFTLPMMQTLANEGIKFDIVTGSNVVSDVAAIDTLLKTNPGSVTAVEGANELNSFAQTFNGASTLSSPTAAAQMTIALYNAVQADPLLKGVTIYAPSISIGPSNWASYMAQMGNLSQYVSTGNWHAYYGGGAPPAAEIAQAIKDAQLIAPGKPVVFTESGYYTAPQSTSWGGVNQDVQAKETLNLLMDAYKSGVQRTYLYSLMDNLANPSSSDREDSFGLFNGNGTAKAAATAVHNLTTILADTGSTASTFSAGSLNYSVSNMPSAGNSLLLEKASGAFDIAVWDEQAIWNEATQSETTAGVQTATVNLGGTYQTVKIFDPMTGTSAVQTLSNVSSVTLNLTDHPLIVEVEPNTTTTSTGSTGTGSTGTGSTSTGSTSTGSTSTGGTSTGSIGTSTGSTGTGTVAASKNGATVTDATGKITDAQGKVWSLVSSSATGYQIAVNGTVDATTMFVTKMVYVAGTIYQQNTAGAWYSEASVNGSWVQGAAPVIPAASANGAAITSASAAALVDASGNSWSLVQSAAQGLQVAVNGVTDTTTSYVTKLELANGAVYQENTASNWYKETAPGAGWSQAAAAPTITPAAPSVITTTAGQSTAVTVQAAAATVTTNGNDTVTAGSGVATLTLTANANVKVVESVKTSMSFVGKGDWSDVTTSATGAAKLELTQGGGVATLNGKDTLTIDAASKASVTVNALGSAETVKDHGTGGMWFTGGAGTATVVAGNGSNTFNAGAGNETLTGGTGSNTYNLAAGHATVNMAGNNTVTGGSGADTFNFTRGVVANATLNDFKVGTDIIHLASYTSNDVLQAMVSVNTTTAGTSFQLGDGTKISLVGVTHLTSNMFG